MNTILKMIGVTGGLLIISNNGPIIAAKQAHPLNIEYPATLGNMKISEFIKLTAKDISTITGKKLNLKEKISFSLTKKNMKHFLKKSGEQTVNEFLSKNGKGNAGLFIIIGIVVLLVVVVLVVTGTNSGGI